MNEHGVAREVILLNCSGKGSKELWRAVRKLKKSIRGTKGWIFGLGIVCIALASELAERKRSENYLKGEIDELKEQNKDMHNTLVMHDQKLISIEHGDDGLERFDDIPEGPFDDDGGDTDA